MRYLIAAIACLILTACPAEEKPEPGPHQQKWHFEQVNTIHEPERVVNMLNKGWAIHEKMNDGNIVIMKAYF